jgi:hypothetical protein
MLPQSARTNARECIETFPTTSSTSLLVWRMQRIGGSGEIKARHRHVSFRVVPQLKTSVFMCMVWNLVDVTDAVRHPCWACSSIMGDDEPRHVVDDEKDWSESAHLERRRGQHEYRRG